jgi:hypothetical protein
MELHSWTRINPPVDKTEVDLQQTIYLHQKVHSVHFRHWIGNGFTQQIVKSLNARCGGDIFDGHDIHH